MDLREYVRDGPAAAGHSRLDRVVAVCLWHRVWLYVIFLTAGLVVAWWTPIAPWFWGYCVGVATAIVGARLFNVESLTLDSVRP